MGWAPRNGFVFETTGTPSTTRLASLVGTRPPSLDVATLAARVLFDSPLAPGATPYCGVRATYTRTDELPPLDGPEPKSACEAVASLRDGLEKGVAHALRGARRVAVLTGGGLDSSGLLALACDWARRNDATVFAAAMEFGGPGDDRPHLSALVQHLGCEVIRARPEDAVRQMDLVLGGADAAPLTWPSAPMEVETLVRAREHGAEIVLTGVGADELLDGNPRTLARVARRRPWEAVASARKMRGFHRPHSPVFAWVLRPHLSRVVPTFLRRWRRGLRDEVAPAWAGPTLVDAIRRREQRRREDPTSAAVGLWDAPHHEHLAWLRHQEDVSAGVECRQVYLERSVRSLVATFAPEWLLHGAVRRGLFRAALRDLLPRSLVERTDKARFGEGLAQFFTAVGGFDRLRPFASGERLAECGLVEPARFQSAFEACERSPVNSEFWASLWPALAVEAFLRTHERTAEEKGVS